VKCLISKKNHFDAQFLEKKHAKIKVNPDMAAAAWKFLKISLCRRLHLFLINGGGGGSADWLTPLQFVCDRQGVQNSNQNSGILK
jgi:hypothetical protein